LTNKEEGFKSIVDYLFQWPSEAVLHGLKRINSDAPEVKFAKIQCDEWIRTALDKAWYPPEKTETYFLRNELSNHDVVRLAWNSHGYRIEVSQTASIFVIKLIPKDHSYLGNDVVQKMKTVRDLGVQLFNKSAYFNDSRKQGAVGVLTNLTDIIISSSFSTNCHPQVNTRGMLYLDPPLDSELVRQTDNNMDVPWDMTNESYEYWFRYIYWWNNGFQIGFYFPKTEGYGARLVSRRGPLFNIVQDKDFFSPFHLPNK
jgi:hypothetical protein